MTPTHQHQENIMNNLQEITSGCSLHNLILSHLAAELDEANYGRQVTLQTPANVYKSNIIYNSGKFRQI